jgi:hypothetical protein
MSWIDEAEKAANNPRLPRGDWHYDDGITDSPDERGKQPCIETIDNGKHVLLTDPYSCDDWRRTDAVGAHIAHWSPDRVLKVLAALRAMIELHNWAADMFAARLEEIGATSVGPCPMLVKSSAALAALDTEP